MDIMSELFNTTASDIISDDDTIGGRITRAREQMGLSTAQLARRLGVKTSTLANWETDRIDVRSNRLATLAGMLNVSATWLLTGRGQQPVDRQSDLDIQSLKSLVQQLREHQARSQELLEMVEAQLQGLEAEGRDLG